MILKEQTIRVVTGLLHHVPVLWDVALSSWWPAGDSGKRNMERDLHEACLQGLLDRHVAHVKAATTVELFYCWAPGMIEENFGERAWELRRRWDLTPTIRVVFYTASERAARHFGRTIKSPLKSMSALGHNIVLGQVYTLLPPVLVKGWVAEEVLAEARGYGEKVVDAAILDSRCRPALAIEAAGASYSASNGQRLRDIQADNRARQLPYEVWTVGGSVNE